MTSESAASALMRFSSTSRRTRSRSPGSWSASSCAPRMSPWAGPIRSVTSFWSAASSESAAAAAARKRAPSLSTSDARMLRRGAADRSPHARTNAAPRATPAATPMPLRTLGMNLVRLRPRLLARLGRQSGRRRRSSPLDHVRQERMDGRDHLRAFTDRRGDPLRRPAANVPDREHSVQARLEGASPGGDVGTRLHEAFRIERDAGARKPPRVWVRADEEEEMTDLSLRLLAGEGVPPADRLQNAAGSLERGYRRLRLHLDVRQPGDAIDQVPRHAGFEAGPADEEPHLRALARQVDHRLARGVSCANDRNLLPCAEPRLDRRSPVVDAGALVRGEVRNVEPAVAGAAGDDDGTRHHPLSVRQAQVVAPAPRHSLAPQAHDLVRDSHLGAELLRLVEGARHQGKAADAGRE